MTFDCFKGKGQNALSVDIRSFIIRGMVQTLGGGWFPQTCFTPHIFFDQQKLESSVGLVVVVEVVVYDFYRLLGTL